MRRLLLILGISLSVLPPLASALEIAYSQTNPFDRSQKYGGEAILLTGEILPGDYERLLALIGNDTDRFWRAVGFTLASPGGDIAEALKIARLVKETYSMVFAGPVTGPCVSACFFIFAAAAFRDATVQSLGIHRPYVHPKRLASMSVGEAQTLQKDVLRRARLYLEDLDVPTNLIDKMFQRASTEVYWLTQNEIEDQLGRRPPWYEQFLIARCGFNKSLERQYFLTNDKKILDQLTNINLCGVRLSRPDARAFLESELKSSRSR